MIEQRDRCLLFIDGPTVSSPAAAHSPDGTGDRGIGIETLASKHEGESLTRRAQKLLEALGLDAELARGAERKVRAGRGKRRGRRYRRPKSALVVLSEFNGSERAFRNLGGVEVTTAAQLNTEMLAPGGDPGRLMVISQPALKALEARL